MRLRSKTCPGWCWSCWNVVGVWINSSFEGVWGDGFSVITIRNNPSWAGYSVCVLTRQHVFSTQNLKTWINGKKWQSFSLFVVADFLTPTVVYTSKSSFSIYCILCFFDSGCCHISCVIGLLSPVSVIVFFFWSYFQKLGESHLAPHRVATIFTKFCPGMRLCARAVGWSWQGDTGTFMPGLGVLLLLSLVQPASLDAACPPPEGLQNLTQPQYQNLTGGDVPFATAFIQSFLNTIQPNSLPIGKWQQYFLVTA